MEAKLSVIIVTYNRARLLPRTVNSILSQDFKDFELVIINNGSTDSTCEICRKYAETDKRVRIVSIPENHGAAYGRNAGIDSVQTQYLIMLDDDDYFDNQTLSHLYNMITAYNADIAVTGGVTEYGDGTVVPKYVYNEIYVYNRENGVSEFLKREKYNTAPGNKLFKTSLFENVRFIPNTRVDDIHVIYKLFVEANKVVCQGLPEVHFCKLGGNMTGFLHNGTGKPSFNNDILKPDILDDYINMQNERVAYISNKLPSLLDQVRYAKYSYMISMVEKIEKGLSAGCDKQLICMKRELLENKSQFLNSKWTTQREKLLMEKYVSN